LASGSCSTSLVSVFCTFLFYIYNLSDNNKYKIIIININIVRLKYI